MLLLLREIVFVMKGFSTVICNNAIDQKTTYYSNTTLGYLPKYT